MKPKRERIEDIAEVVLFFLIAAAIAAVLAAVVYMNAGTP